MIAWGYLHGVWRRGLALRRRHCRSRKSVEYVGVGKLGPTASLIYNSLEILSDLNLAQIALRYAFPKAQILVHHDQNDDPALQEASKGE